MAAVLLAEVLQARPDRQRGSVDVRVDHRLPVLHGLLQKTAGRAEARVGEEGVHAAEAVERRGHEGLLVLPARHVAAPGEGVVVAAQLARQLLELVLGASGERDAIAELPRPARGRGPYAGAGSGYDEYGFVGHGPGFLAGRLRDHDEGPPTCEPSRAAFSALLAAERLPVGAEVGVLVVGPVDLVAAVGAHRVDVEVAVAIAGEGDPAPIRATKRRRSRRRG